MPRVTILVTRHECNLLLPQPCSDPTNPTQRSAKYTTSYNSSSVRVHCLHFAKTIVLQPWKREVDFIPFNDLQVFTYYLT